MRRSLKLIDFGLTLPAEKEFMLPGNRTGTPNYMAPEVVRRKPTDQRLDIFAYGVSMYELFAFDLPWQRGERRPGGHGPRPERPAAAAESTTRRSIRRWKRPSTSAWRRSRTIGFRTSRSFSKRSPG